MTKQDAVRLFGTTRILAEALDITPQAIYQWPDKLSRKQSDLVTGAAVRLGKFKPSERGNVAA